MTGVTSEQISSYRAAFSADPSARIAQNAVCNNAIDDLVLNREVVRSMETGKSAFSTQLDSWPVTNQKSSGRCWLFAALNLFRPATMKLLNLKDFEFSQTHIHFWDKMERANCLLQAAIDTADRDWDDRTLCYLLSDPIGDGGQWNMAMNLVRKHGLVPKAAFPETHSSGATMPMNNTLKDVLRSGACELRSILQGGQGGEGGGSEESRMCAALSHKQALCQSVWRILCIHLGTPPETFEYCYTDKDGKYVRLADLTPQLFASRYVQTQWEQYVCLVHDPRNPYMCTYTVDFLQNVAGGPPVVYLNVPIDELKRLTMEQIVTHKTPVWMGCDVGKQLNRKLGIWDLQVHQRELLYNVTYGMCKADRLRYRQTMMTHAMLFTGVDVSEEGRPTRWRVENSWGDSGGVKGYYTMNDCWFDEHMFEIAAPRSSLTPEMLAAYDSCTPIVLPAWDPMGSLARGEALLTEQC